jgi:xylan 1,4-beta-xylosidase
MGLGKNLNDVERGFEIINGFPEFRNLPIVLTESDPEGCAACSMRDYPQNAYRNGPLYAVYTAAAFAKILDLAEKHHANLAGILTWAFEFEGQPYFAGFRDLATNGIDKPVLNLFRMAGMLSGERIHAESSGAISAEDVIKSAVVETPDVGVFATRSAHEIAILLWNYHDDELPAAPETIKLAIEGLPLEAERLLVHHYRIDGSHSNSYSAWKRMGAPQPPTPEQQAELEAAGQLELLESPRWISASTGASALEFALPRHSVSLIRMSW